VTGIAVFIVVVSGVLALPGETAVEVAAGVDFCL
jgi:hypothetical protein